jgi:hypothetical protein
MMIRGMWREDGAGAAAVVLAATELEVQDKAKQGGVAV